MSIHRIKRPGIKPLHVALLAPLAESVPPRLYGGTERVVAQLCQGLRKAGIGVTLFASAESTASDRLVPVVDEAIRLRKSQPAEPRAYEFEMLSLVARQAHRFDLIHNHNDYWMLPISELADTPFVTTLHGRLDLPELRGALLGFPRGKFISISDSQRAPIPELDWVGTIHHGIDLTPYEFHPEPGKYLAFLGRISPEKRPDWAIEVARRSGVPLKMAAKIADPDRDYYEACIRPHIDGKFIEYIGEISDREKSEFLGNALGLVFPIDWPEPFGLVMIESLATGTPVLTRARGAVEEIITEGRTGFMRETVDELAGCVENLARLDRRICRSEVEQRFSLDRMIRDYVRAFRSLTEVTTTSRMRA